MTIHYLHEARVAPRLPARQPKDPISRVLAIMRADDPAIDWVHEMREACRAKIEMYVGILDLLDGDPDLEPELAEDASLSMWGGHGA